MTPVSSGYYGVDSFSADVPLAGYISAGFPVLYPDSYFPYTIFGQLG